MSPPRIASGRSVRKFRAAVVGIAVALPGSAAPGQTDASSAPGEEPRLLTLGTPMLRSTMERVNLAWVVPEKLPDFRLKIDRPTWEAFSQAEMETRLRGVEIRLPLEGLWVGYEKSAENENPRVTFSIQRGF